LKNKELSTDTIKLYILSMTRQKEKKRDQKEGRRVAIYSQILGPFVRTGRKRRVNQEAVEQLFG